jgi:hypothetical protein
MLFDSVLYGPRNGGYRRRVSISAEACAPGREYRSSGDDVLKQTGDVSGKVIVTCSLPVNADNTDLVIADSSSSAEALARKVPKARVVSASGTRVPLRAIRDEGIASSLTAHCRHVISSSS